MFDFQHLNLPSYHAVLSAFPAPSDVSRGASTRSGDWPQGSHSDAHRIASSQEARNNPVLALRLIAQGKPADDAIAVLGSRARSLSSFTQRRMLQTCPGWELMDDEDQNQTAFTDSLTNGDSNGYRAGFAAALRALEKHVDLWKPEDMSKVLSSSGAAPQDQSGAAW